VSHLESPAGPYTFVTRDHLWLNKAMQGLSPEASDISTNDHCFLSHHHALKESLPLEESRSSFSQPQEAQNSFSAFVFFKNYRYYNKNVYCINS